MTAFTPNANYYGETIFFDGSTFRGALRQFGIINPVSYYLLSDFIAEKWPDIVKVYKLSSCSGGRPKFSSISAPGRAIISSSIGTKRKTQQHLASSYPTVLSLDINKFYGSIYTHSIPWAVLGKTPAKALFHAHTLSSHWSAKLDKLARNCNQRQTIGTPIGPDTSRIISELILSRLDVELCAKGTGISKNQVFHNIDDYQFGIMDTAEAENAQSHFVRTLARYEFRLNDFKTKIEQGLTFSPSNFQRRFDHLNGLTGKAFVEHFFEILYELAPMHVGANVIGYSLKRFAKIIARNEEKELIREYLQRLIYASPHQARWAFPILIGITEKLGLTSEVKRLIAWGVNISARRNDTGSLLWFLYAAIYLNVKLNKQTCLNCLGLSNELIDLMLVHGKTLGLFSFNINKIRHRYLPSNFQTKAWLPLYEIEKRGWDNSPAFSKIGTASDQDSLYEKLRFANVDFYTAETSAFTLDAFEGWNITAEDFSNSDQTPTENFSHFLSATNWENYE